MTSFCLPTLITCKYEISISKYFNSKKTQHTLKTFLFDLGLKSLSTSFSLILTVSGCVTLYWHWADQFSPYFLNAERKAKEQLEPFLKSLVWPSRGSNPQPPSHKADALPEPLCWNTEKQWLTKRIIIPYDLSCLPLYSINQWSPLSS